MANVPKLDYDLTVRHYWRRIRWMVIRYVVMALVVTAIILAAVALVSHLARMQVSLLEQDISDLRNTNSALKDDVAGNNEKVRKLQQTNQKQEKKLQDQELVISRDFASDELATLVTLISRRLEEGVSLEQLTFYINQSGPDVSCNETDSKLFRVRTQLRPLGSVTTVSFDDGMGGRITITGSGQSALSSNGLAEEWFDVQEPVDFTIVLAGSTRSFGGVLPWNQTIIWEEIEYRFVLEPSVHRDLVRVGFTRCRI